jgi:hypothetical protein
MSHFSFVRFRPDYSDKLWGESQDRTCSLILARKPVYLSAKKNSLEDWRYRFND